MSHVAVVERFALNRKSLTLKISFTRDKSLPVPFDTERIPDRFELSLRCSNPKISGHINDMQCSLEIDSINIDDSKGVLSLVNDDGFPLVNLEIQYSSISIISNILEAVVSAIKGVETE